MKLSNLALLGIGVAVGASLFRNKPLITITHNTTTNTFHVTNEATKAPPINNEEITTEGVEITSTAIENEPIAEEQIAAAFDLIQPYMGPDRARTLRAHIAALHGDFSIWAGKLYRQSYQQRT